MIGPAGADRRNRGFSGEKAFSCGICHDDMLKLGLESGKDLPHFC